MGADRAQRSVCRVVAAERSKSRPHVTLWQPRPEGMSVREGPCRPGHAFAPMPEGKVSGWMAQTSCCGGLERHRACPPAIPPNLATEPGLDELRAAMKKWPNVAAGTGWLALDARGDWYMRDERIQTRGAFPTPQGQNESARQDARVHSSATTRRRTRAPGYSSNGPQRVYRRARGAPPTSGGLTRGRGAARTRALATGNGRPPSNRNGSGRARAGWSSRPTRLRHREHAGHGGRRRTRSRRAVAAARARVDAMPERSAIASARSEDGARHAPH